MIASLHIADIGPARAARILFRPPKADPAIGLRRAEVALAAPLRAAAVPCPWPGRVALLGFWEDGDCLDRFAAGHPLARLLAGGWQARLEPLRAHGSWPGLPDDIPRSRIPAGDGPVVVVTLARTRISQLRRFLATSLRAERAARSAPGLIWGIALARPPFFATCSIWTDANGAIQYAYGQTDAAHGAAIAANRAKPFHRHSAFVRFRLCDSRGSLPGAGLTTEAERRTL